MINDPETLRALFPEVMDIYFHGMLTGWLADSDGTKAQTRPDLPGLFSYESEYRVLADCIPIRFVDSFFFIEEADKVTGAVEISVEGIPVWCMHYQGMYPQHALPIVRAALSQAFAMHYFYGGRGRICYFDEEAKLGYVCRLAKDEGFFGFAGIEQVVDLSIKEGTRVIGYHEFCGGSLIHGPLH